MASADQVKYMVEHDTLGPLCSMLEILDDLVIRGTLEAIENILKAAGQAGGSKSESICRDCGGGWRNALDSKLVET